MDPYGLGKAVWFRDVFRVQKMRFHHEQRLRETEVDAIFGPYVKGKRRAETAVATEFGANGVILHLDVQRYGWTKGIMFISQF